MFKGGKGSRDTVHTKLLRELSHLKELQGFYLILVLFSGLVLAVLADVCLALVFMPLFLVVTCAQKLVNKFSNGVVT